MPMFPSRAPGVSVKYVIENGNGNGRGSALTNKRPRHPWRVVIVVGGLILAANLMIYTAFQTDTNPVATQDAPETIEGITPNQQALIRPQDDIGVDLADTHTGVLEVDGVEIPEDQLVRVVELGQVSFRPGPDREFERWSPGPHQVTVTFWPVEQSRSLARTYSWGFRAG